MAAYTPVALLAALVVIARGCACSVLEHARCDTAARTDTGWVCGCRRRTVGGAEYASFLSVPYAKQPLGELRFQELQPAEPWYGMRDATTPGPVCPQTDVFYGPIQTSSGGMSEACIHANIHVPLEALPDPDEASSHEFETTAPGLPILVFIHGGGFAFGSGDTDLHGPEYLVSKGVIVITFNYRLNVFGFLSLNSSQVPGNAGLRDAVTLLCWVRNNARAFGGDPDAITIAGQSAGAVIAHLLTLSPAAQGLFKGAIALSGNGISDFFSTSPNFATDINKVFLPMVGINATLPADEIHQKLIEIPLDTLMAANKILIDVYGTTTFTPVVESLHSGMVSILDNDPEVLVEGGRGRHVPLLIGFTDVECESFRRRFEEIDIVSKIEQLPNILVSPRLTYRAGETQLPLLLKKIQSKYFNGTVNMDSFVQLCTDQFFKYPALKLASKRATTGAPVFLYRFSYDGIHSVWKEGRGEHYQGAGHVEDITYFFRTNSVLGPVWPDELTRPDDDAIMKNRMTDFIINFMRYSHPSPGLHVHSWWAPVKRPLLYQELAGPHQILAMKPTEEETEVKAFFDSLYEMVSGI